MLIVDRASGTVKKWASGGGGREVPKKQRALLEFLDP